MTERGQRMLKKEENELLTRVGPGTPGGEMLRRYWQPAALSVELPPGGPPVPLRLLGEGLVMFRDQEGRLGLLGLHCSHRGADLSYGRLEDGGIRCLYHGWLYDVEGRCLEQPGEPAGSTFHDRIRHPAYRCHEVAGVIFTYMGPGEPPLFPNYELFRVPDDNRWVHKQYHECSYLQGNEGNIDSIHVRFLHRYLPGSRFRRSRELDGEGRPARPFDESLPSSASRCEETHFGVRIYSLHDTHAATYMRTTNFVIPLTCAVPGGPAPPGDGYLMNWHVPIDDTHHWRFSMAFKRSGPLDPNYAQARASVTDETFRSPRNKANRYLQDREEQKHDTYAGMGPIFVVQDAFATETAGEIQDRSREHLAASDAGLAAARRMMLRAIKDVQEDRDPPHVIRRPEDQDRLLEISVTSEQVPVGTTWEQYRVQRGVTFGAIGIED
ncbi:MAG: Rieske 2Fe-2S domain-containing protein [Chloroflexi bacterium]|nr:Rieske 2Fe-2S domain-containing protein [Chloroflexota bacterium]